eukprot:gene790-841_t
MFIRFIYAVAALLSERVTAGVVEVPSGFGELTLMIVCKQEWSAQHFHRALASSNPTWHLQREHVADNVLAFLPEEERPLASEQKARIQSQLAAVIEKYKSRNHYELKILRLIFVDRSDPFATGFFPMVDIDFNFLPASLIKVELLAQWPACSIPNCKYGEYNDAGAREAREDIRITEEGVERVYRRCGPHCLGRKVNGGIEQSRPIVSPKYLVSLSNIRASHLNKDLKVSWQDDNASQTKQIFKSAVQLFLSRTIESDPIPRKVRLVPSFPDRLGDIRYLSIMGSGFCDVPIESLHQFVAQQ